MTYVDAFLLDEAEAKLAQAQARIASLETALDTFSDFADAKDRSNPYAPGFPDDLVIAYPSADYDEIKITLGHCRAARTARRGAGAGAEETEKEQTG